MCCLANPIVRGTRSRYVFSVFIRGFPGACQELDIRNRFSKFGDVSDVYIPKRQPGGRKFGFVHFLTKADMRTWTISLG